jgi:retinol dehydrogenase 12
VYIVGRSREKAEAAIATLKEETGSCNVHYIHLDLANLLSVTAAAKELASKERRLHLLFNNA